MKIKVSVIIPVYNVESVLEKCLDSVINQTLNEIEIIVVNDGSPDNSQKIIDKFAKKDKRIKSFIKENGGLSDARNYGIERANGEYILFVDSDDYIDSNACSKLYEEAKRNNLDILVGNYYDVKNGKITENICKCDDRIYNGEQFIIKYFSQKSVSIMAWLLFCKREYLNKKKLKFLKGVFHEDEEFSPRAMLNTKRIKFLDYKYYYYVYNSESITKKKDKTKNIKDIYSICDKLESEYIKIKSVQAKKLLIDRLVYIRLLAFGMQNVYDEANVFPKEKIKHKAFKLKNRIKSHIYTISPKLYLKIQKYKNR